MKGTTPSSAHLPSLALLDKQTKPVVEPETERKGLKPVAGKAPGDKSNVVLDQKGRVDHTVNPEGKRTDYHYDEKDHVKQVTFSDKYSYRKQEDGTWGEYDPDGKKVQDLGKGEVSINKEGTLIWTGADGTVKAKHLDGSKVITKPDKSQTGWDKDGKVKFTVGKDGKRTDY